MATKLSINELRSLIKETLQESLIELGSVQATSFLKLIEKYYPEKLNYYKSLIYNKSLKHAYLEFSKQLNKTPENVEKIMSKYSQALRSGKTPGNPFGITGVNRDYVTSDEMIPKTIELNDYIDKVNEMKSTLPLSKEEITVLNTFFNPANFEMVNNAIVSIAERHNNQLEKIKQADLSQIVDPYSNMQIIDVNDDEVVVSRGAYYQNYDNAKKAINVQDAKKKTETALAKKTLSGLRWVITNSKLSGKGNMNAIFPV